MPLADYAFPGRQVVGHSYLAVNDRSLETIYKLALQKHQCEALFFHTIHDRYYSALARILADGIRTDIPSERLNLNLDHTAHAYSVPKPFGVRDQPPTTDPTPTILQTMQDLHESGRYTGPQWARIAHYYSHTRKLYIAPAVSSTPEMIFNVITKTFDILRLETTEHEKLQQLRGTLRHLSSKAREIVNDINDVQAAMWPRTMDWEYLQDMGHLWVGGLSPCRSPKSTQVEKMQFAPSDTEFRPSHDPCDASECRECHAEESRRLAHLFAVETNNNNKNNREKFEKFCQVNDISAWELMKRACLYSRNDAPTVAGLVTLFYMRNLTVNLCEMATNQVLSVPVGWQNFVAGMIGMALPDAEHRDNELPKVKPVKIVADEKQSTLKFELVGVHFHPWLTNALNQANNRNLKHDRAQQVLEAGHGKESVTIDHSLQTKGIDQVTITWRDVKLEVG